MDKLYDEFRTFGALLNAKIEKLQSSVAEHNDQSSSDDYELRHMRNLRECIRSAADVVSNASTTINVDTGDKASIRNSSDFGDVFVRDTNEPMLRWFTSNTVYEYEDVEAPLPAPSEANMEDTLTEYQSDSDSDLEKDLIWSLFHEGEKRKQRGDLESAIRHFKNCLARLPPNTSYTPLASAKSSSAYSISRIALLEHLIDSYSLLELWSSAKATMVKKLVVAERQGGRTNELYLKDTLRLAEFMMKDCEYMEAHLQARRSLRGFKRLGISGHPGYEECLRFMIPLCKLEGKTEEEEAYLALLATHQNQIQSSRSEPNLPPLISSDTKFSDAASSKEESVQAETADTRQKQEESYCMDENEISETISIEEDRLDPTSLTKGVVSFSKVFQLQDVSFTNVREGSSVDVMELDTRTSESNSLHSSSPKSLAHSHTAINLAEMPSIAPRDVTGSENIRLVSADQTHSSVPQTTSTDRPLDVSSKHFAKPALLGVKHTPPQDLWTRVASTASGVYERDVLHTEEELTLQKMTRHNSRSEKEVHVPSADYGNHEESEPWTRKASVGNLQIQATLGNPPHITISNDSDEHALHPNNSTSIAVLSNEPASPPNVRRSASDPEITLNSESGQSLAGEPLSRLDMALEAKSHQRAVASSSGFPANFTRQEHAPGDIHLVDPAHACLYCDEDTSELPTSLRSKHLAASCIAGTLTSTVTSLAEARSRPIHKSLVPGWSDCIASAPFQGDISFNTDEIQKLHSMLYRTPITTEGTWACVFCRSEDLMYLSEIYCKSCSQERNNRCPSSDNGFGRLRNDFYRTPIPINLNAPDSEVIRRKAVLLGHTLCGKTFLASRCSQSENPKDVPVTNGFHATPTSRDHNHQQFRRMMMVDGRHVELMVWDIHYREGLVHIGRPSYENAHIVLICFDITDPRSLDGIEDMVRFFK